MSVIFQWFKKAFRRRRDLPSELNLAFKGYEVLLAPPTREQIIFLAKELDKWYVSNPYAYFQGPILHISPSMFSWLLLNTLKTMPVEKNKKAATPESIPVTPAPYPEPISHKGVQEVTHATGDPTQPPVQSLPAPQPERIEKTLLEKVEAFTSYVGDYFKWVADAPNHTPGDELYIRHGTSLIQTLSQLKVDLEKDIQTQKQAGTNPR